MTPTGILHTVYPAGVRFPDGTVHTRCKVYATPEGLAVYYAVKPDEKPDWSSPIDFAATGRPRTGYQATLGWEVHTDAGLVIVTAEGGCGCGWSLKRWNPAFARTRLAWRDVADLRIRVDSTRGQRDRPLPHGRTRPGMG